jgi:hypothetical protein
MADTEQPEPNNTDKSQRHRSPSWPFIPLAKALERVREFYRVHRDKASASSAANVSWSMKPKSGAGGQTIATLRQYGLMQEADASGVQLTEAALRIVRDTRESSPERDSLIREAAIKPRIFTEMWEKWGKDIPADAAVEFYLVQERGYSEEAAKGILANYKATIRFAKLVDSDNLIDNGANNEQKFELGKFQKVQPPPAPPARLMEGERIVFTHEVEPAHGVRVIASGEIDAQALAALDTFVRQQRRRLVMNKFARLQECGFKEIPTRELWFSRERRIAFSHEAIRDMDPAWMERRLAEDVGTDDFVFHLISDTPERDVAQRCTDILREIGLSNLHANIRLAQVMG